MFVLLSNEAGEIKGSQCIYFVMAEELSDLILNVLNASLCNETEGFVICPRTGTVSPWSSKATDIFHTLGLKVERIERGFYFQTLPDQPSLLFDRMTEQLLQGIPDDSYFKALATKPLEHLALPENRQEALKTLQDANKKLGLAMSPDEVDYIVDSYKNEIKRSPTDVELYMFAQINSEHCRHKVFGASWNILGKDKEHSLFGMIKNTYEKNSEFVLSAYSDNAAVLEGSEGSALTLDASGEYVAGNEKLHCVIKVETHNHPTAISPFPGAATGSGGEIRDEGATGIGSRPLAGLTGFSVSDLLIPWFTQPWEKDIGRPSHVASALDIMIQGPLGGAAFNNEFGRPNTCGYFRTLTLPSERSNVFRGFHKPIMIAGGHGLIRDANVMKRKIHSGDLLIVLGGPGLLIGLGGGAASSVSSSAASADLDFASVQRANPEMQRRCQQVIDACTFLGEKNPIISIHDVGAGGLCNALPEIVHDAGLGAEIVMEKILIDDKTMSPLEIWCNESQERYVLAIGPDSLKLFESFAKRERCPFSVVGKAVDTDLLHVSYRSEEVVHIPMSFLFGKPPKMHRIASSKTLGLSPIIPSLLFSTNNVRICLEEAADRILSLPCVASKSFLITIGDRSVTGLICREQMVGPWQVPVADCSVAATFFTGYDGTAMAMGERPTLALISPAASARMAVGEALTNIAASRIDLKHVRLSANWMASAADDDAALYEAVEAIGMDLCPKLGICIPVGKDSMSMKMKWEEKSVVSPVTCVITAFAKADIRKTLTPILEKEGELILIDIGQHRMGGSAFCQVYEKLGDESPDVVVEELKAFMQVMQECDEILAYHDRSDGGLFITLCEMSFAGRVGVEMNARTSDLDGLFRELFNEELGAVIQVKSSDLTKVMNKFKNVGISSVYHIGKATGTKFVIRSNGQTIFERERHELQKTWSQTSFSIQSLRDTEETAQQEFELLDDVENPGLNWKLTFDPIVDVAHGLLCRPRVAILREQGVNGHNEMAFAFHYAGFTAVDVHMTDIIDGRVSLSNFKGLAACGGFSYGDVLGAGRGWALSILHNSIARQEFETFFSRSDVFALGVCNGCQMISQLGEIIHDDAVRHWPRFMQNKSRRFEGRTCMVQIPKTDSIFMKSMQGSCIPIAVAHGEGRAEINIESLNYLTENAKMCLQFVDNRSNETEHYPLNPNGSPRGITGVTALNGRITVMMPHPERVINVHRQSWSPKVEHENGPWLRMFRNARQWIG